VISVEIREPLERDEGGIRDLFRICFGRELSHEEWIWKYKHSPWGSYATIALDGDRVVAHYGGIRNRFYFKGKTLYAYQFCDVMTHPLYRARIFSKTPLIAMLNKRFYQERSMDFAYGFPSLRHARLQCIRLGGEGYRYVKIFKKSSLKKQRAFWRLRVEEGWKFLEGRGIDRFLINHDTPLQLAKDRDYLRWRYKEHPHKDYRLIIFKRLVITKGLIIFTLEDEWFNILECFFKNEEEFSDILISLENYIVDNLGHVKGIRAWFHPGEQIRESLHALGYGEQDDIPYTYRTVNKECGLTNDIFFSCYFYRMGDYDAV